MRYYRVENDARLAGWLMLFYLWLLYPLMQIVPLLLMGRIGMQPLFSMPQAHLPLLAASLIPIFMRIAVLALFLLGKKAFLWCYLTLDILLLWVCSISRPALFPTYLVLELSICAFLFSSRRVAARFGPQSPWARAALHRKARRVGVPLEVLLPLWRLEALADAMSWRRRIPGRFWQERDRLYGEVSQALEGATLANSEFAEQLICSVSLRALLGRERVGALLAQFMARR